MIEVTDFYIVDGLLTVRGTSHKAGKFIASYDGPYMFKINRYLKDLWKWLPEGNIGYKALRFTKSTTPQEMFTNLENVVRKTND